MKKLNGFPVILVYLLLMGLGLVLISCKNEEEETRYTVTFDANDGNFRYANNTKTVVDAGSSIMLLDDSALSRDGFVFNGWNTNSSGTGTNYNAGSFFTPIGNITLYAKWVIDTNPPIQLTENTWVDGSISSNDNGARYSFNVTNGTTYYVWWNDSYEDDSTKTMNTTVNAVYSDGTSIFTGRDSGWTNSQPFTANTSGTVKIKVTSNNSGYTGTFAAAYSTSSTRPGGNIVVPGNNLDDNFSWLQINAASGGSYTIEVNDSIMRGAWILKYSDRSNITITIRGIGSNRIIRLLNESYGRMFTIGSGVTLILDNNITLEGRSVGSSNYPLVYIDAGTFTMNNGSTIKEHNGSGVYVEDGIFNMNGGTISGNARGVHFESGTFNMNSGTISNNTSAITGTLIGGVYIGDGAFTMNGGTITNNGGNGVSILSGTFAMRNGTISNNNEGGVCVLDLGTFTMNGGTISGNTALENGGGVFVGGIFSGGTFIMSGGTISGNTASSHGGGVYISGGSFTKTGGTIYGYSASDTVNSNVVKNDAGTVQKNKGHTVYAYTLSAPVIKETTAGIESNLSFNYNSGASYWGENWDNITYTITYNINGGGGTLPNVQTAQAGSIITLPGGSGLLRSGFVFNGWYNNSGTNYSAGSSFILDDDITLYAKWDPNITPTALTEDTWADGNISSNSNAWYSFDVTSGNTYYIWWNDSYEGDSTKTLNVAVNAFYSGGTSIFTSSDSGWTTPQSFIADKSGTVQIRVTPYNSGYTGTFAVTYNVTGTRPTN